KRDWSSDVWSSDLAYEAIMNLPIKEDARNQEYTRHMERVKKMLSYIPPGENAWYAGVPEELRLNVSGARLSSIYKRLDPDKPAYTVTGSGGGGTHMYHWKELRALQIVNGLGYKRFQMILYFWETKRRYGNK